MAIKIRTKPDLFFIRGDSATINLTVTGIDLTGATVYFTARATLPTTAVADDSDADISVAVTDHSDPTNGKTVIPLSATDTDIDPGKYYYDIQIKNGSEVTSIPTRRLEIISDTTRT